jgi:hypothetical protein
MVVNYTKSDTRHYSIAHFQKQALSPLAVPSCTSLLNKQLPCPRISVDINKITFNLLSYQLPYRPVQQDE